LAVAAVAIDPLPIKGVRAVPYSQLKSTLPVLGNPKNKKRTVSLTARQFQYSFGNAIDEAESNELFEKWNIPAPGRPLFEDATSALSRNSSAAVDTQTAVRGPLLLTAGLEDHMVPPIVTQQVFSLYRESSSRTDYRQFPGRGHSLTIDHGWQEVAQSTIDWLTEQGF
jgi:esterase/lipase